VNLNDNERKVLSVLARMARWDENYMSFDGIRNSGVKLDRKQIRRACRSLARKGLAEYGRGLWNDDGEVGGSGYCATKAGVEAAAA
jgi:hypothetical protein